MHIIRINLNTKSIASSECPSHWNHLAGRALISQVLTEEVNPTVHPLDSGNKLVIAPGILAGFTITCVNRISVGAKSPLTGTIKESNAGGNVAYAMGRLGIKALIIEGAAATNELWHLYLSSDGIKLVDALPYKGYKTIDLMKKLKEQYHDKIAVTAVGPAGERRYQSAGIAHTDKDGRLNRYSGRGGLGAVMGSKGLKAIVYDMSNAKEPDVIEKERFQSLKKEIVNILQGNQKIVSVYAQYGTANLVSAINAMGGLPTFNYRNGQFDGADSISGQHMHQVIKERGGEGSTTHACMPGCMIRCSNVYPDHLGNELVSPLEYETIGLLGSNLGIDSLDTIAHLNRRCNELGLDTIEIGGAIGVAMEAGVIPFGDSKGALNLLNEIENDSFLGKVIASGAGITGKVFSVTRVPVVKNQTLAAYDPRVIKGLGVTYATSTQGGDHTAGISINPNVDHLSAEGKSAISLNDQINNTIHDCYGTCFFVGKSLNGQIHLFAELYAAMTGASFSYNDFVKVAQETLLRERAFNEAAGFNVAHDRLPRFFNDEPIPTTNTVFDVATEELDSVFIKLREKVIADL